MAMYYFRYQRIVKNNNHPHNKNSIVCSNNQLNITTTSASNADKELKVKLMNKNTN